MLGDHVAVARRGDRIEFAGQDQHRQIAFQRYAVIGRPGFVRPDRALGFHQLHQAGAEQALAVFRIDHQIGHIFAAHHRQLHAMHDLVGNITGHHFTQCHQRIDAALVGFGELQWQQAGGLRLVGQQTGQHGQMAAAELAVLPFPGDGVAVAHRHRTLGQRSQQGVQLRARIAELFTAGFVLAALREL